MQNFGVREICDVVLKAKANTTIGNKKFYKNEPVILFDTLKTSSLEGAATTVYAEGGKGNTRLMSWDGERTMTFTMEDALISPEGFMILSGAGLVEASEDKKLKQHIVETIDMGEVVADDEEAPTQVSVPVKELPFLSAKENFAYVMFVDADGNMSEPFIPDPAGEGKVLLVKDHEGYAANSLVSAFASADHVLVDYYTEKANGVKQIEIEAGKFSGNFYLEASTLFRDTNGVDHPAEFIIPNCKVQSNFTFTMASTGDPSTFTFTMDAFPDYTRFDHSKKVLAALQVIDENAEEDATVRTETAAGSVKA